MHGDVPYATHREWRQRFPWLVQGTTVARSEQGSERLDLAMFGVSAPEVVRERWQRLMGMAGVERAHHGRQVHGSSVLFYDDLETGLLIGPATDGHVTRTEGSLLGVTVADCVPIFLVDPSTRAIATLHAGWRGLAAGIVDMGLRVLRERFRTRPDEVTAHLGPAICGECYEVGPEVFRSLGLEEPAAPRAVDLRAWAAGVLVRRGVSADQVTTSGWCTRCGGSPFFSHRGGDLERQVAFAAVVPDS